MIAFNLNWMYFDSQACKHFVHALRRHWFTSFLFTMLHLPLCMTLLLASSAISRLVVSNDVTAVPEGAEGATGEGEAVGGGRGLIWFFGAGLGAAICVMAMIGLLHKSIDDDITSLLDHSDKHTHKHDPATTAKTMRVHRTISRRVTLSIRVAAGVVMILLPLKHGLTSMEYLAIYMGITAFLIIAETIARLEKREWDLEEREEMEGEPEVEV